MWSGLHRHTACTRLHKHPFSSSPDELHSVTDMTVCTGRGEEEKEEEEKEKEGKQEEEDEEKKKGKKRKRK